MTPVIICGADLNQPDFDYTMQELANLAEACDMEVKDTVIQNLSDPFPHHTSDAEKQKKLKPKERFMMPRF